MDRFNFFKALGICAASALVFAGVLFLLALNWRITLWSVAVIVLVVKYWNDNFVSQRGQFRSTATDLLNIAFLVGMCWFGGYLTEILFGYSSNYWEITALKGLAFWSLIILSIGLGQDLGWWKKPFWKAPKNYLILGFFYLLGATLVWLFLTYVLPYLYHLIK